MWANRVVIRNPFNPRDKEITPIKIPLAGLPILELCEDLPESSDVKWLYIVNGQTVEDDYIVSPGEYVVCCPTLQKDNLGAILKLVLAVVVMVLLPGLGAWWAAAILIGGNLLIDAVLPPPSPDVPTLADAWTESPTYGWGQLRPTKGQGYVIPLLYGTHKVSGQVLSKHITTSNDKQILHLMMSVCHGEVDSITDIRLNDQPVNYFRDVLTYTRLGTNNDTVIPGFGIIPALKSVNVRMTTTAHIVITTGNLVEDLALEFALPNGLYAMDKKGNVVANSVSINVSYRLVGDVTWTIVPTNTFTAASTEAVRRTVTVSGLTPGQYEVSVVRLTTESTNLRVRDAIHWSAITEIINEPIQYNNLAKYAVSALATDQLSGAEPVLSALVSRLTVQVYNPNVLGYEPQSASNPAWAGYDLLHNPVSGNIPYERIDYDKFKELADYCDELVGTEPRHTCNMYIDTPTDLWRNLTSILQLGRAAPLRRGSTYSLVINKLDTPVQMFTQANIVAGSFSLSYSSVADRANAIEITYTDATRDYTRQVIAAYSAEYNSADTNNNKASMRLFGCTSPDEIMRECAFRLNSTKWTIRSLSFSANIDALAAQSGDLIYFQHDAPEWAEGGRIVSATLSTVTFDKPLYVDGASTYTTMIRMSDDSIVEKELVATVAGEFSTFTLVVDFLVAPTKHDPYMFGKSIDIKRVYRITDIAQSSDLTRKISCAEYNEAIFTDTDYVFDLPTWDPKTQDAVAVNTAENITLESDGTYITHVNVTWMPAYTADGYDWTIWLENLTSGTEPVNVGRTVNLHFVIPSDRILTGNNYMVYITRYDQGPVDTGQNTDTFTVLREFAPPSDVLAFTGTYNPITRTVIFSWAAIDDIDLDHYEIREGGTDWDTATPILDNVTGASTSWYIDQATVATLTYWIKAIDRSEIYSVNASSAAVTVDTTKTNLPTPTGLTLTTGSNILPDGTDEVYLRATWDANAEISDEFSHYDLEIETATGWPNAVITQKTEYTFAVVANATYTVRLRAADRAGNDSAWVSVTLLTAKDNTPPEQVTWPGASSDIVPGFKLIGLSWAKSSATDIAGYVVERSVDDLFTVPIPLGTVSANYFVDTQLDVSAQYWYRVKGIDRSGNQSDLWSTIVTGTTLQVGESDIAANSVTANMVKAGEIFTNNLQSANYVADTAGYNLNAIAGTAEFNNIQMVLNWGTDVVGTDLPEANATLGATWGSDIADPAGTMPADGADVTNYSDLRITNATYIDPSVWVLGTSGTQGDFIYYGVSTQSAIKNIVGPFGILETCWECIGDGVAAGGGGWQTNYFGEVDPDKSYRVTVWAKQTTTSGTVHIGLGTCYNLDGTENTNPYFWSGGLPSDNTWYLLVGILHPQGYTGAGEGVSGVYDLLTGDRVIAGTEFKSNGATTQRHRALIAGTPVAGELKHFTRPRFEEINGNEPSLIELMGSADVTSANTSLDTSNVNGTPAATVQANALNAITAANNQSADGILSTQEKATWRVQWPSMLANHDSIISQATTYGIEANAEFVDFTSDKDILSGYLTTTLAVWSLPDTPATISPDTQLTDYVTLFYDAMQACVNSLADYSPQNSVDAGLDTTTGGLVVRNSTTQDYAHLTAGDLNFFYWNGTSFELYQSVNRLESGVVNVVGGRTIVPIPGKWKNQPNVTMSPNSVPVYDPAYPTRQQALAIRAENVIDIGGGNYEFDAVFELALGEGILSVTNDTTDSTTDPYVTVYSSEFLMTSAGANVTRLVLQSAGVSSGGVYDGSNYNYAIDSDSYLECYFNGVWNTMGLVQVNRAGSLPTNYTPFDTGEVGYVISKFRLKYVYLAKTLVDCSSQWVQCYTASFVNINVGDWTEYSDVQAIASDGTLNWQATGQ